MAAPPRGVSKDPHRRAIELVREFRAMARTAKRKGDTASQLKALSEAAAIEKDLSLREHRAEDDLPRPPAHSRDFEAFCDCLDKRCRKCGRVVAQTIQFNMVEKTPKRRSEPDTRTPEQQADE